MQPTVFLYGYRQMHGELPDFGSTCGEEQDAGHRAALDASGYRISSRAWWNWSSWPRRAIQAEVFLPSEQSFYCAGCPFQVACKAWVPAGGAGQRAGGGVVTARRLYQGRRACLEVGIPSAFALSSAASYRLRASMFLPLLLDVPLGMA